jgi:hypothetical protein
MAANMQMTAFWDIAAHSLVDVDWRFRGAQRFRLDDRGSTNLWNVGLLQDDYTEIYSSNKYGSIIRFSLCLICESDRLLPQDIMNWSGWLCSYGSKNESSHYCHNQSAKELCTLLTHPCSRGLTFFNDLSMVLVLVFIDNLDSLSLCILLVWQIHFLLS